MAIVLENQLKDIMFKVHEKTLQLNILHEKEQHNEKAKTTFLTEIQTIKAELTQLSLNAQTIKDPNLWLQEREEGLARLQLLKSQYDKLLADKKTLSTVITQRSDTVKKQVQDKQQLEAEYHALEKEIEKTSAALASYQEQEKTFAAQREERERKKAETEVTINLLHKEIQPLATIESRLQEEESYWRAQKASIGEDEPMEVCRHSPLTLCTLHNHKKILLNDRRNEQRKKMDEAISKKVQALEENRKKIEGLYEQVTTHKKLLDENNAMLQILSHQEVEAKKNTLAASQTLLEAEQKQPLVKAHLQEIEGEAMALRQLQQSYTQLLEEETRINDAMASENKVLGALKKYEALQQKMKGNTDALALLDTDTAEVQTTIAIVKEELEGLTKEQAHIQKKIDEEKIQEESDIALLLKLRSQPDYHYLQKEENIAAAAYPELYTVASIDYEETAHHETYLLG